MHICNLRKPFTAFSEYQTESYVCVGDGKSQCRILGIRTIAYMVNNKKIRLHNVLFVLSVDVSLYSIKKHMNVEGCYKYSKMNVCTLAYPSCIITATTANEIIFNATIPKSSCIKPPDFDDFKSSINIHHQHIPYQLQHKHGNTIEMPSTFKTNH